MSITPSPSPWPSGSTPASPPYAGTVSGKSWAETLAERYIALSPLPNIGYDATADLNAAGELVLPREPAVEVAPYQEGGILTLTRPSPEAVTMNMSRADAYSFILDTVLLHQSPYNIPEASVNKALEAIARVQCVFYLPQIAAAVPAANKGAAAGVLSSDLNLGTSGTPLPIAQLGVALARASEALSQQGVPANEGRWIVVPYRIAQAIRAVFPFTLEPVAPTSGPMVARWGEIPIYEAPGLASNRMLVGHRRAIAHALRVEVKNTSPVVNTFALSVNGAIASGVAVVAPEGIAEVYIA